MGPLRAVTESKLCTLRGKVNSWHMHVQYTNFEREKKKEGCTLLVFTHEPSLEEGHTAYLESLFPTEAEFCS